MHTHKNKELGNIKLLPRTNITELQFFNLLFFNIISKLE